MFRETRRLRRGDRANRYFLGTRAVRSDGYRTAFGGVEIRKNHVSAHVMPPYVHPDLLAGTSDGLRRRMQGKACLNLSKTDEALLSELEELIDAGAGRFDRDVALPCARLSRFRRLGEADAHRSLEAVGVRPSAEKSGGQISRPGTRGRQTDFDHTYMLYKASLKTRGAPSAVVDIDV